MKRPSAAPAPNLRILVVAHNDPRLTKGGAEIAAFQLYGGLAAQPGVQAWFLGCSSQPGAGRDAVALTQPFGEREFLYTLGAGFDWFKFSNPDPRLPDELADLLRELRPDIVHLQHYVHIGVEAVQIIKRTLPDARIVVTLHEYLAICNHYGQMVKRDHDSLCSQSGPHPCHGCFPEHAPSDFFLRRAYIGLAFDRVDHFICPSRFLLDRYAEWGIDRGRLSVIENLTASPSTDRAAVEPSADPARALKIGFFGQISALKGARVLMECAEILSRDPESRVSFELNGDYSSQPEPFQKAFLEQLATCTSNVNFRGRYTQDRVDALMRGVDAVLVPSIWWENSPVVIEEALRNRRPVICSDIGGMAEKVRDGIDGLHFRVGSAVDLAVVLRALDQDRTRLSALQTTLRNPTSPRTVLENHLRLYAQLLAKTG
jgi:glycosyltransferase involved in cell wall biosynthesis